MSAFIFYIMGKSSSGKDTLYRKILKETKLAEYTMYTTRPQRSGEEEGREYHFVTPERFEELKASGKVIEYRTYMTVNGPWTYFTVDDGSFDTDRDMIIIGTPEAFVSMRDYFGKERIIPLYIECDDGDRLQRALNRERKSSRPDYKEMCRRFLADAEDFSEERLKSAGIDRRFYNVDISLCCDSIIEYINDVQGKEPS